jgi:hypothetical protein
MNEVTASTIQPIPVLLVLKSQDPESAGKLAMGIEGFRVKCIVHASNVRDLNIDFSETITAPQPCPPEMLYCALGEETGTIAHHPRIIEVWEFKQDFHVHDDPTCTDPFPTLCSIDTWLRRERNIKVLFKSSDPDAARNFTMPGFRAMKQVHHLRADVFSVAGREYQTIERIASIIDIYDGDPNAQDYWVLRK